MKNIKNHKFITIEGVDGAGKSTALPFIEKFLQERGEEYIITREPGGTPFGEKMREIVRESNDISVLTETMIMFTARAEHINKIIKPALDAGKWVICDRFTDSTFAYQSMAKGLPETKVKALEKVVQDDVIPGLTLVFDVPVSVSRSRLKKTGKEPDKFERENDGFFQKVIDGYKQIVKNYPSRCKMIDATIAMEERDKNIHFYLEEFYNSFDNKTKVKNNI